MKCASVLHSISQKLDPPANLPDPATLEIEQEACELLGSPQKQVKIKLKMKKEEEQLMPESIPKITIKLPPLPKASPMPKKKGFLY